MTTQLTHRRVRLVSESSEYYSSGDEFAYSVEKEAVLAYLKQHGSTVLPNKSAEEKHDSSNTDPITLDVLLEDCTKNVEQTLDALSQECSLSDTATVCCSGDEFCKEEDFSSSTVFASSNENTTYGKILKQQPNNDKQMINDVTRSRAKPKCFLCSNFSSRVKDGNTLSIGDHIKFGRYSPTTKSDRFLRQKLKGKLGFLYYHHAVVTEICKAKDNLISLCVVHFTKGRNEEGQSEIRVLEERMDDLDLNDEFIFKVEYHDSNSSIDDVLSRARSLKGSKSYSLFTNNCEHVAMWCCTGIKVSFQWDNKRDSVEIWSVWFSTFLGKIPHLASVADDIITATRALFTKVSTAAIVSSMCFPILAFIVEAIMLIRLLQELKTQLKQKLICLNCYSKKRTRITAKLVVGFVTSIALMLPTIKYALPIIGVSVLALVVLPWACERLITKVKSKINPTSVIPKMPVQTLHDIQPGDVLTVYEGFSSHDVLVEKVQLRQRDQMPNIATVDIIHYAFQGLLGTRTIKQETINIKLDSDYLYVYDFPDEKVFSNDAAVTRAIRNIGEQKFNMFTNRSSHFAWKCKVLPNVTVGNVDKRQVHRVKDVNAGDVIQFKYCSLPHVAIVSYADQYTPLDIITVEFIHVDKNGKVCRDVREFDLDESYVFVQQYSDGTVEDNTVVLERARSQIGEEYGGSWVYKSARFAINCKQKEQSS